MRIIQKYGGTSLMDAVKMRNAAGRIAEAANQGHQVVAVVSAQGHTTDKLIADASVISLTPPAREMDAYLAAGEQMSAGLMVMCLGEMGLDAISLAGWQAGLLTDGEHGSARVTCLQNDRILRELERGKIVIVAGFQGVDTQGDITTLGRGGSDTTAVALAAFLHADICQIYTDVDGVYDKDPRKYPNAVKFDRISYDDMLALVHQGAQVLHDRCVELGKRYGVPIQVLSSFRSGRGTLVTDEL